MLFDLVLAGARVIDPETGLDAARCIGITDGRIAAVTTEALSGKTVLDCAGLVAAPGFIDIHTHEDISEPDGSAAIPVETAACGVRTGNTTLIGGNCGHGNYPIAPYLDALGKADLPANCFSLAGNVTLRQRVGLDNYTPADSERLDKMIGMAADALDEGAIGISFGLQYAHGTTYEEFSALCSVAAKRDKFVSVHMRYDYPAKAIETVKETLRAARETGVAMEISHLAANVYGGGNLAAAAKLIEESGCDVTADVYPYDAWATSIQSAVFDDGFDNFNFGVTDLEILSGELAGQYCTPELFAALRAAENDTAVACHNAIPIRDVEDAYRLPFVCVGSDAQMSRDRDGNLKGHPRSAGSPAKFLREFVREKKLITLMEGIKKLTLIPAERCKLSSKGRLQVGCDADITVFNPDTISERSEFGVNTCALAPEGIAYVVNGGRLVHTGAQEAR